MLISTLSVWNHFDHSVTRVPFRILIQNDESLKVDSSILTFKLKLSQCSGNRNDEWLWEEAMGGVDGLSSGQMVQKTFQGSEPHRKISGLSHREV